jgi:hypothetical protein
MEGQEEQAVPGLAPPEIIALRPAELIRFLRQYKEMLAAAEPPSQVAQAAPPLEELQTLLVMPEKMAIKDAARAFLGEVTGEVQIQQNTSAA